MLHLARYRSLKTEYKQKIIDAKANSWQDFVSKYMQTDVWGMPYKVVSEKIRAPTLFSSLRREDGSHTERWRQSAEMLMTVLLPSDNVQQQESLPQRILRDRVTDLPRNQTPVEPFTEAEVQATINNLKKRKAPGPDNIQSEVLQEAAQMIVPQLTSLFNECLRQGRVHTIWKRAEVVIIKKGKDKDTTNPKSYRPICLLNTMGKALENVLCGRLKSFRESTGSMQDSRI